MIILLSVIVVIAGLAFYAGYHTGYSAGYVDQKQDAPIDWDKWMNA